MTERLCIDVSDDDIMGGIPQDPRSCAIARGARRLFPDDGPDRPDEIKVGALGIIMVAKGFIEKRYRPEHEDEVRAFIDEYDRLPGYRKGGHSGFDEDDMDRILIDRNIVKPRQFCFVELEEGYVD